MFYHMQFKVNTGPGVSASPLEHERSYAFTPGFRSDTVYKAKQAISFAIQSKKACNFETDTIDTSLGGGGSIPLELPLLGDLATGSTRLNASLNLFSFFKRTALPWQSSLSIDFFNLISSR